MKLSFSLDICENSSWYINTVNTVSKRMPFYIIECGHFIANKSYYTEREGYEGYLLIYTLSGSGFLKYDDEDYILEPNHAILINCSEYHIYKTKLEPWNFKWVYFNGTSAGNFFSILFGDSISSIKITQALEFENNLDSLSTFSHLYDLPSIFNASSIISNIFSTLIENKISIANNKEYLKHRYEIEKVINFIHLNYQNQLTLDDLTKVAHLSKFYFLRIFKDNIGISPYEYLITYRINKAKELLLSTDSTVSDICKTVGFNDYVNFIRTFKKIVDLTPLKYRRQSNVKFC